MLRTLLLASALAVCAGAPALADPAANNWTGAYAGVNLGYGGGSIHYPFAGSTDAADTNPISGRLSQSSSGIIGGGQIGYNFETAGGFIIGAETDIDGTGIHGRTAFSSTDSLGAGASGAIDSHLSYLGTVRARVGDAMFDGRFMPYLTGGLAYGDAVSSASFSCSACGAGGTPVATAVSQGDTKTGWTLGAGADYALTQHLSFGAEYLRVDLGKDTLASNAAEFTGPDIDIFNATVKRDTNTNIVRVRMNYRF